jgi:hypothetical protein
MRDYAKAFEHLGNMDAEVDARLAAGSQPFVNLLDAQAAAVKARMAKKVLDQYGDGGDLAWSPERERQEARERAAAGLIHHAKAPPMTERDLRALRAEDGLPSVPEGDPAAAWGKIAQGVAEPFVAGAKMASGEMPLDERKVTELAINMMGFGSIVPARGLAANSARRAAFDPANADSANLLGANRSKKGGALTAALQYHAEREPILPGDTRVSTRFPTAVRKTEDPLRQHLNIGLDEMKASKTFAHNMAQVKKYPGFGFLKGMKPAEAADAFVERGADNLNFLYDNAPQIMRERSPHWYEGANRYATNLAERYGIDRPSASAAIAALSPQKDWFQNASLAERAGDVIFGAGASKKMSSEMNSMIDSLMARSPNLAKKLPAIKGKSFSQMENAQDQALWLRVFDESHNPRGYRSMNPEGDLGGFVLNADGRPSKVGWGSTGEINKAVRAYLSGGDMDKISGMLGDQNKVRSFYNNIENPYERRFQDVTADTHQVGAVQLRPMSSQSREVLHNFGGTPEAGKHPKNWIAAANSTIDGVLGTYGLTAEATRRAALAKGLMAREMQSSTWEPVRELFTDTFKNKTNNAMIDGIWRSYDAGKISLNEARKAVLDAAAPGGIGEPSWARPDFKVHGGRGASTYR